ncbi:hypothetical protein Tcan_01103, partial [Toxocara canis]
MSAKKCQYCTFTRDHRKLWVAVQANIEKKELQRYECSEPQSKGAYGQQECCYTMKNVVNKREQNEHENLSNDHSLTYCYSIFVSTQPTTYTIKAAFRAQIDDVHCAFLDKHRLTLQPFPFKYNNNA